MTQLYRFIKLDAEFARLIRFNKSSVAFRVFAGAGYEFNSTRNPDKRNNLPFFKQYFSGGPNSMRAWALRRLGPGSTIKEFTGTTGNTGPLWRYTIRNKCRISLSYWQAIRNKSKRRIVYRYR